MATLAEAREDVATALSEVDGYDVRARPFPGAPRAGDGWVTVQRIAPADFANSYAQLTVVIVFGPDQAQAETAMEEDAVDLLNAITLDADCLNPTDVALEPLSLVTGTDSTPLYGAALTLTLEVE